MSQLDALKKRRANAFTLWRQYRYQKKWAAAKEQKKRVDKLDEEIARLRGSKVKHVKHAAKPKSMARSRDGTKIERTHASVTALRRQREAARRRNDRAAVMRYDETIETLERRLENDRRNEGATPQRRPPPGYNPYRRPPPDWTPNAAPGTTAPAGGGGESEVDTSATSEESFEESDQPWYKRYGLWIGGAVLVGAVYAYSQKKGKGGGGKARGFTFPQRRTRERATSV